MPEPSVCRERIMSEQYMDFILYQNGNSSSLNGIDLQQLCEQKADYLYRVVYVDELTAGPLTLERYAYHEIPNCYGLMDIEAMNQAGISAIQNYPTLQLKGERIMIGFIDTGIDYENPIFRNQDGTTRITGIWDQTIQSGTPPEGFLYGTNYTEEMINEALRSTTPQEVVPSTDDISHGTFMASLAAGGRNLENQFIGAAPEAKIAVVKLKPAKKYLKDYYFIKEDAICYQENDIILGLKYLNELARQYNMPLVICIALGTNTGGHDGTSVLSAILEVYSNMPMRAVVVGGGNEANARHHYYGVADGDLNTNEIEIRVEEGVRGFTAELWTDIPNVLEVSMVSPSGERIPRIPLRSGTSAAFNFIFERTQIFVDYRFLVRNTNSELIFFRFEAPSAGIWRIVIEPTQIATGIYHLWLPITEFLDAPVYFLEANPDNTITEPGNGVSPMTAAYYDGANNSIAISSGRGYTRDERVKPDFAAPGVNVNGAILNNQFATRSGSSIAAGITAGAAALLMEWIVYLNGESSVNSIQIKNLLILGAERKVPGAYPNREWGYGALNLYNAFEEFRRF